MPDRHADLASTGSAGDYRARLTWDSGEVDTCNHRHSTRRAALACAQRLALRRVREEFTRAVDL